MPPLTTPNTGNYMIGRGVLSIAEWSGGSIGSYQDVGNCPKFEMEVTEQTVEHYSSREGTKLMDAEITIQVGYTVNFSLDEIAIKNLQMFLKATNPTTNVLRANMNTAARYAIKFVTNNAVGPNMKFEFWKVKLTPQGAFSLIGDDIAQVSFTGKGLADSTGHSTSPYLTVTWATTTTTTTAP